MSNRRQRADGPGVRGRLAGSCSLWGMRRGIVLLVLAGLLAACSLSPSPTAMPTASPFPGRCPSQRRGRCPAGRQGIYALRPRPSPCQWRGVHVVDTEKTVNAPSGFENPWDVGTLVLTGETTATFTSSHGMVVTLDRVRPIPSIAPCI